MADQPITGLPTKTASGVASTDKMLGIDSAEGYQILVRDVAKYIIENCNVSTLAGAVQTPKAAIDALNSKLTLTGEYNYAESFSSAETLGSKLDELLNAQSSYGIGCYRLSCTASFGVFQNGYDYYVQMARASSLSFVIAEFTPVDNGLIKILGKRRTEGWSFELAPTRTEIDTLNSKLVIKAVSDGASQTFTLDNSVVIFVSRKRSDSLKWGWIYYVDQWSGVNCFSSIETSGYGTVSVTVSNNVVTVTNNTGQGAIDILAICV